MSNCNDTMCPAEMSNSLAGLPPSFDIKTKPKKRKDYNVKNKTPFQDLIIKKVDGKIVRREIRITEYYEGSYEDNDSVSMSR